MYKTNMQRQIGEMKENNQRLLIAIDGRCAAGKTTLAALLADVYKCNVVHMDHFFLTPEQRTDARLKEPGGNVDYERFFEEVLTPLWWKADFAYRPYDCQRQTLGDELIVRYNPITIIEGTYSCHPMFRAYYDLRMFMSIEPDEQIKRITGRDGVEQAKDFIEKWIPLEEQYFSSCHVEECCDLLLPRDNE
ncbi:MAG: uridine kinase [Oscillospiraceae bacterium]|nr:uridine kinase [Oscillospiraceae bacterium]